MEAYRDRHHIIFEKALWNSRPDSKRIRDTPSLIVRMDREDHNEIHRNCPPIPILGYYGIMRTLSTFEEGKNPLVTMESLMSSFENAGKNPKAHEIDRRLAELAAWSLDLQRPFIADVLQRRNYA